MSDSRRTGVPSALWPFAGAALLLVVGVMCHRLLDGLRWGEALYETLYAVARLVAVDDRGWSVGGRTFLVLSGAVMGLLAVPSLRRLLRRARGT